MESTLTAFFLSRPGLTHARFFPQPWHSLRARSPSAAGRYLPAALPRRGRAPRYKAAGFVVASRDGATSGWLHHLEDAYRLLLPHRHKLRRRLPQRPQPCGGVRADSFALRSRRRAIVPDRSLLLHSGRDQHIGSTTAGD
jgi:hypothetical protein